MKSLMVVSLLFLAACPKKSTAPATTMGGGGSDVPAGNTAPFAGNMAEAPTHDVPKIIEVVKPNCNQASYFKLNVEAGKAFTIDVKTSAGCAGVAVLNQNGGSAGDNTSIEVCADSPKTLSATGQEGATFVDVKETGACAGNTVTLDIK